MRFRKITETAGAGLGQGLDGFGQSVDPGAVAVGKAHLVGERRKALCFRLKTVQRKMGHGGETLRDFLKLG